MSDNTTFVSIVGIIAVGLVALASGIIFNGQMNLSKDHELRRFAMEHGYTCNKEVLMGDRDLQWVCK